MHKLTLLTVGGLREPWAKEAAAMYRERLRTSFDLTVTELPASRQTHAEGQKADESQRLLAAAKKLRGALWVLDERGKPMTSADFAEELSQLKDRGEPAVFLLGGAFGFDDEVRSAASKLLSLSRMTFPHELCRIVLLEQLYRAAQIMKGSGYHH